jgi:hypothetical protein
VYLVWFLLGDSAASIDAGKSPRRKHMTLRTLQKFEIKNNSPLWGGTCKTKLLQMSVNHPEENIQQVYLGLAT